MVPKNNSVKESLRNTGLVGGSQVVTILIGLVRTKFIAILLGPSGIGLIQLFTSTIALVQSISGFGIGFSGIKDISESIGSGNQNDAAKTILSIKRWSFITGLTGVIVTLILSKKLSQWTFGKDDYWIEMSILSVTVLLSNISAAYGAVVRGARQMKYFAKISIFNSLFGSLIAIIIYFFYGKDGIVPVIILMAIVNLIVNYFYSNKIVFPKVIVSYKSSFTKGLDMVKLGLFTVLTGFLAQLSLYYARVSININLGSEEVGYYAVATTLAVTYMSLIFTAMSADYFPKLSSINKDNTELNRAVIEQTKIVLLLGTPLILGMYTFSEFLISLLYTSEFKAALPLLLWMLLSVFLRLIGFPIGYVFLAKGKGKIFVFTQTLWNFIFVVLVFLGWKYKGDLVGVGMAFTASYAIGVLINIMLIKKLTFLQYDSKTIFYIIFFSLITLGYFYLSMEFSNSYVLFFKVIGLVSLIIYSYGQIQLLLNMNILEFIKSKF